MSEKIEQFNGEENEILKKIMEDYHSLTASARKVADYILSNPRSVVYHPITEMAEICGVSEYSVVRLCKSIGLSGYQELKLQLSKAYVNPLQNIHEELEENDRVQDIADKLANSYINTIESTKNSLDASQIKMAIEAIENANKIEFYGLGTSAGVAKDAFHKFFRLDYPCRYLEDGHMQAMSASLLKPNDVVIAISNSGSTKDIIDALKEAKKSKATTICITSHPNAPITKVSDIKIVINSVENFYRGEPMENRIAQIYIVDLLFVSVALKKKELFLSNLNKTRNAVANKK